MNNRSDVEDRLQGLVAGAKRDLAWLASIHVILKSNQQDILPQAERLLKEPESFLRVGNLPSAEAETIRKKAVETFRVFSDCVINLPSQDPGHYLNKSAILYADAILQAFLDKSYEIVASYKNLSKKELTSHSIGTKLQEISSVFPESSLSTAKHVRFIAQLRHIITHNNGFVDKKFLENCGIDYPNQALAANKTPLWDTQIWPDLKTFLEKYKPPDNNNQFQASLAIENVIIPYLRHSIDFLEEILQEFLKAVK